MELSPAFYFVSVAVLVLLFGGRFIKIGKKPLTAKRIYTAVMVRIYDRLYPNNTTRGVYSSYAEAVAAAPHIKGVGYDSANAQNWYEVKFTRVGLEDYPVLYWLRQAFAESKSLLEIGGHTGVAYYGFATVLEYPTDLSWTIVDVPTVMQAGEAMARERQRTNLHFAHGGLASLKGADILLTTGALQYLDTELANIISGLQQKPKHVLINTIPAYDGPSFTTLQNLGKVHCAYRIFNNQAFIDSIKALGYTLVDSWAQPRQFRIPGHPDKSFDHYSGYYFRKE